MKHTILHSTTVVIALIVTCCHKDELPKSPPMVTTGTATDLTPTSVTISGEITSTGNSPVTSSGVVYSQFESQPTLRETTVEAGVSNGAFKVSLTKLLQGTTYHVRTFALNAVGVSYGAVIDVVTGVETVSATYNGNAITYGVIVSVRTGRTWLDRNLGAIAVATSATDYRGYGDLFQWGRQADGHQLIKWNSNVNATIVNGSTSTTSSSDNPGNSLFIYNNDEPLDWRIPQNNTLWQGVTGINNPCPAGWRLPTSEEWKAEAITTLDDGYSVLKLTIGGWRHAGIAASINNHQSIRTLLGIHGLFRKHKV